jgi:hypothetical protein
MVHFVSLRHFRCGNSIRRAAVLFFGLIRAISAIDGLIF